jgi:hypothetical protein
MEKVWDELKKIEAQNKAKKITAFAQQEAEIINQGSVRKQRTSLRILAF